MVLRQLICVLIILQIIAQSYAQQPLPMPRNLEITFEKGTRSKDGRPGRNYWQNKADYTLNVNFDPITRQLTGSETIEYSNNSPDTLSEIWFFTSGYWSIVYCWIWQFYAFWSGSWLIC